MSDEPHSRRLCQNFDLIWLDENIHQNNENCRNSIMKLREVIGTVDTFVDIDECIDFVTDQMNETVVMVTSKKYIRQLLPLIPDLPQVKSIYILCQNQTVNTTCTYQCTKVKGIFIDVTSICEVIKQALKDHDQNEVSISFANSKNGTTNVSKDNLDCSFMYTEILKEILLTVEFTDEHFTKFLTFCRTELSGKTRELKNVDKIQQEYKQHTAIWWYTCETFLYSMLNRALRLMDIDTIVKVGFFVCDLHNQLTLLHAEQFNEHTSSNSFTVYRGQGLSQLDFDKMKENTNGLLAFNNFLSTTKDRRVSLKFIRRSVINTDLVPILFIMHIDPMIRRTPFANITDVSAIKGEEEILFSMHSVFRIRQIKKLDSDNTIWEVVLTLTSQNDPQLHALTETVRKETKGSNGWHRLGKLMIKLAKLDQAEELYRSLLRKDEDLDTKADIVHQLGYIYSNQAKHEDAIAYYQTSLEIWKKCLPVNHPLLATSYSNIGNVYNRMGEFSKALEYYQTSLEILKKSLPADHPDLATSYNNIGLVYDAIGEYLKALEYFQTSLEMRRKSLPVDHPDLATSYNNIGSVYDAIGEYLKALEYYQTSLEMRRKSLPVDHPDLATSYNNIGRAYDDMGEYSRALEYYEKSLEMRRKSLPVDHPDLAASYNNIGGVYDAIGEYLKALEYYQTSIEMGRKCLSVDHPLLATSYNNIGLVYRNMGEYLKALQYFQISLEMRRKSLPVDHPLLATSYNNIGLVYRNMGEYSKALEYLERALYSLEKSLPANHPNITTVKNNIYRMKPRL